ncbi:E3 ubiquitin-protein ligase RNF180 isoform X1 [Phyllopteryx taeniolatus]|uniref:E3 ubiquitin-protein ligase RNF180 isoform X1 n=1 Tax=Phyllopteryx taeniolatus TaxID=161469 RepID=UPI002AD2BC8B|nr:E3 ubiquitin-protein ligase RNF180 isoform X1 [Phyllopteryx taeniolatus]
MLRCRKCRKVVIESLQESEVTNENSEAACNIWHMDVDALPDWILTSIHQAQWTVGRLNCQKCGSRLGGFNFSHRVECPCGRDATVHFSKCRVDHDHKQNLLIVQPRWTRPNTSLLLTDGSQAEYERWFVKGLQLDSIAVTRLPDPDEAAQVITKRDSVSRSSPFPVLYPMDKDDEVAFSAVTGCSSVSAAREAPLECQMVHTEDHEGSSAENSQDDVSLYLRGTPMSYSAREQEEAMVHGTVQASIVLRRQSKKEKNHLKSQRRKRRRRELWLQMQANSLSDLMLNSEEDEEEAGDRQGLTCAVCLDVYFHPYSCQPCSHVFCEPCLRKLAKNREESTPCPLCRALISHTNFHAELSRKAKASFPRVYHAREQYFQNASCVQWPLPSYRKPFFNLWGYRRYAVRAHRSWHFAHVSFSLQAFDLADVCGWFFGIRLANWMMAFLFLTLLLYYFYI